MNSNKNETRDSHPKPRKDVAVYLDFENLYISLKTTAKMDPDFEILMEKCREFGRVTLARSYADWSEFARMFTTQQFANGIEPVYVPTRKVYDAGRRAEAKKNSVDIHIAVDITKSLFIHENVDVIILISGDRDYVPLINQIRQQGKEVYAIGVAGCTSSELSIAVDEMFYYHQLLESSEEKESEKLDVYNQLLKAIQMGRRRGYPTTLGILKPIMKELIEGFHERNYKNPRGNSFQKFKDLVLEAERRHLVKIVPSGNTIEVILWAEKEAPVATISGGGSPRARSTTRRRPARTSTRRTRTDEAAEATDSAVAEDDSKETTEQTTAKPAEGEATEAEGSSPAKRKTRSRSRSSRGRGRGRATKDAADSTAETADTEAKSAEESTADSVAAEPTPAPEPVPAPEPALPVITLNDDTWAIVLRTVEAFEKPPTPRKLILELKKARTAGAFGDVRPTDENLDGLVKECVESGRLTRKRKGFSAILLLPEANEE